MPPKVSLSRVNSDAGSDSDGEDHTTSSLPALQRSMRRDPEAYVPQYRRMFTHFQTTLDTYMLGGGSHGKPPAKTFTELAMFLAHVYPSYPALRKELDFPGLVIKVLGGQNESRLHSGARKTLVQALVLLRNQKAVPLLKVLPVFFKVLGHTADGADGASGASGDKEIRKTLIGQLVKDIAASTDPAAGGRGCKAKRKLQAQRRRNMRKLARRDEMEEAEEDEKREKDEDAKKENEEDQWEGVDEAPGILRRHVQKHLFEGAKSGNPVLARCAVGVLVGLYARDAWKDEALINAMAPLLLHKDQRVATGMAQLFLGNRKDARQAMTGEESDAEEAAPIIKEVTGAKRTRGSKKKLEKAKSAAKKKKEREDGLEDRSIDFTAMDLLHDPHATAEKLLQRAAGSDPFALRLLCVQLVCRLVGRHELLLLGLYPFLQRHLRPRHSSVTKVLAGLVQACHSGVPPQELAPVAKHIIDEFISERCAVEVMTVGLNTIRELCDRCSPLVLDGDQLGDLIQYRSYRNKSVATAARGLVNLYREDYPELLPRADRGKEASMKISRGQTVAPVYGATKVGGIDGIELLDKHEQEKRARGAEGGEEGEGDFEWCDSEAETLPDDDEGEWEEVEEGSDGEGTECEEGEEDEEEMEGEEEEMSEDGSEEEDEESGAEESEDEEEAAEEPSEEAKIASAVESAQAQLESLAMTRILGPEDFLKMKKLKIREEMAKRLKAAGSKRERDMIQEEMTHADDVSEAESDDSDAGPSKKRSRRSDDLHAGMKGLTESRATKKEQRMAKILAGREGRDAKNASRARRGGSTNKEKLRKKPMLMSIRKASTGNKVMQRASDKLKSLQTHVKNLKKQVGPQKRRRK